MVLRDAPARASPQRNAVGQCGTKLIAEIVAAQGEGIGQRVVVGKVGAIVIAKRTLAIGEIKPIHLPAIPLAVNSWPVMHNIFGIVQAKMIGLYRASLPIGLGVVLRNAETASLGIEAKIGIEGPIFLAGNHY